MENFSLHELVSAVRGEFLSGNPHAPVRNLSTDGRALRRGDYFVALQGKNFDGHDFLKQAVERGAAGIVVSRQQIDLGNPFPDFPAIVRVNDTLKALGDIARCYREKFRIPLIGITGSNGKTTTKEMLASILRHKGPTVSTTGNFNNRIGLPLTLFNLTSEHRYAVVEMGTSIPGEIGRLTEIASPSVGIITNIGLAHLENFKSQEGVLEEKSTLFRSLPDDGYAVVNNDDPYLRKLLPSLEKASVTYGVEREAQVQAKNIRLWPEFPSFDLCIGAECVRVTLPLYGRFNVYNALAAAAAAWKLGIDSETIKQGLEHFSVPRMRMEVKKLISGVTIINDAYNANPTSVKESVQGMVTAFPDREKIVVLGDMLELGVQAEAEHFRLGEFLVSQPLSKVFLYGPLMEKAFLAMNNPSVAYFKKKDELEAALRKPLPPGAVVLFKASRGMALEEIANKMLSEEQEFENH
jgi:UDP-N-acetylmuramoyl-tripeptide--D-alanyl-D-alanine ligase